MAKKDYYIQIDKVEHLTGFTAVQATSYMEALQLINRALETDFDPTNGWGLKVLSTRFSNVGRTEVAPLLGLPDFLTEEIVAGQETHRDHENAHLLPIFESIWKGLVAKAAQRREPVNISIEDINEAYELGRAAL